MKELFPNTPRASATFFVPGDPFAWERAGERIVGSDPKKRFVQHYDSADQVAAKNAIRAYAVAAGVTPFDGPVILDVVAMWLYPRAWSQAKLEAAMLWTREDRTRLIPKPTRPDYDNLVKIIGDALQGRKARDPADVRPPIAFDDDGCIWLGRCAKAYGSNLGTFVRLSYGDVPPRFPERWWPQ